MSLRGKNADAPPPDVLALQALAVVIGDDQMRERFQALTGYDAATLRARAGTPAVRDAVIAFLAGFEPDLLRVAETLGVPPEVLAAAGTEPPGGGPREGSGEGA